MSTAQKIIKNLAIAFAIFLIVSIITGILSALFGVSAIIGLTKDDKHISEELKNVELQQTDNSIRQIDIDAGVGSLKLNINGKKEDYKIKVSKGIGAIRINGDEVSNDSTTGNGENYIEIDGGIGDIRINIQD